MPKHILYLLFLIAGPAFAEDKAEPGEGWKVWEMFIEKAANEDEKKAKALTTENFQNKYLNKNGFKRTVRNAKKGTGKFIKEFQLKEGIFLHIQLKEDKGTVFLIKEKDTWKINDLIPGHPEDFQGIAKAKLEIDIKVKRAVIMSQLSQIAKYFFEQFRDEGERTIPNWKELEIPESLMKYTNPSNGKEEMIIIAEGSEFTGESDVIMAATPKPIGDAHAVLWEDGHVTSIKVAEYQKIALESGLINATAKEIKLSLKELSELTDLINKLGAKKFKERKSAKEELLKKGLGIVTVLEQHLGHKDFEVQVSLKEIIKELKTKSVPKRRVKK